MKELLTDYSLTAAADIFNQWTDLETMLLVKYIDGNVKEQHPDGTFIESSYKAGVPGKITNRDYTRKWMEAVVEDHGDVIEMR